MGVASLAFCVLEGTLDIVREDEVGRCRLLAERIGDSGASVLIERPFSRRDDDVLRERTEKGKLSSIRDNMIEAQQQETSQDAVFSGGDASWPGIVAKPHRPSISDFCDAGFDEELM